MSLDHEKAKANFMVDGLAICCFNPRARIWELGYMRHAEHELFPVYPRIGQGARVCRDFAEIHRETSVA